MASSESSVQFQQTAQEPTTGFTNIDSMIAVARAKYASKPQQVPRAERRPYAPTSEDAESNERIGIAVSKARGMIAEAKTQLAAPCMVPEQLTVEELDDQAEWRKWDDGLRMATECNDRWLADNQTLFEEVMDSIPEPDEDWDLLLEDVQIPTDPMLRCLEALERISAGAKCWIAISKARSREHMIRDAPLKPVLVVKPAQGSVENGQREEGGVARRGARSRMLRDGRKTRIRRRTASPSKRCEKTASPQVTNRAKDSDNVDEALKSNEPTINAFESNTSHASSLTLAWQTLASWDYQCTWQ